MGLDVCRQNYVHQILAGRLQQGVNMSIRANKGIDYVGWSTHMFDTDRKIDQLLSLAGWRGFCIYFFLIQHMAKTNGYYLEYGANMCASISKEMSAMGAFRVGTVSETVALLLRIGLLDKGVYSRNNVLTSKGIQRSYLRVLKKRNEKKVFRQLWILNEEESEGLLKVDYFESESNKNAKKEEKNDDFRYREQTSISSSKSSSKDIKRDARAREESASPPHTLSQHEIQKRFDHIWNKYPYKSHRLTGKGKVSAANKLRIVSLESKGNQITKAMKNYKLDCEINDWREKLSACSFFGEHYVRFLDENWEEPKPERRKKQNGFKNFTERSMDAHDRHVQEHGYRNLEHALLETSR